MSLRLTRANSQKLSIAAAPDYNSAYTFLFAFRPEDVTASHLCVAVRRDVNNADLLTINNAVSNFFSWRQIVAGGASDKFCDGVDVAAAGVWYYVAMVRYSATSVEVFIGTTPDNMVSATGGPATLPTVASRGASTTVEIGGLIDSTTYANGRFRYGLLANAAWTLPQIKTRAGSALWADWALPDATTLTDASGASRTLTATGTPTTEADDTVTWPQTSSDRRAVVGYFALTVPDASSLTEPTAAFTASVNVMEVSFTDESTQGSGAIASYSWVFADGDTSTEQNPTHTYAIPGTYVVQLTVTDANGLQDSISHSVVVGSDCLPTYRPYSRRRRCRRNCRSRSCNRA